jgi:hypothetical protein
MLFCSCGQKAANTQTEDTIKTDCNYTDTKGLRENHWILTGTDEPTAGYGMKDRIEEGNYHYGEKEGVWIKYNPGNQIKYKIEYKDDSVIRVIGDTNKQPH